MATIIFQNLGLVVNNFFYGKAFIRLSAQKRIQDNDKRHKKSVLLEFVLEIPL